MSTDSPPQLSDPAWLRRRLVTDGTMGIALELHVSRYQVRKACERFGLSRPAGRRRGATPDRPALRVRRPASEQIADRIAAEQALDPPLPATVDFVLERCGNVMRAHYANDRLGVNDALVSLASACGLVVDHMQRVNAA